MKNRLIKQLLNEQYGRSSITNKYNITQKLAQVEIEAMEYQINTLVTLARKMDFNPAIMDRIITLEDELANLRNKYDCRAKQYIDTDTWT